MDTKEERGVAMRDPRLVTNTRRIEEKLASFGDSAKPGVREGVTATGEWYWGVDHFGSGRTIILGIEDDVDVAQHADAIIALLNEDALDAGLLAVDCIVKLGADGQPILEPWTASPHTEKWFRLPDGSNAVAFVQQVGTISIGPPPIPPRPTLAVHGVDWAIVEENPRGPATSYTDAELLALAERARG